MRINDWSSDVCSSDLHPIGQQRVVDLAHAHKGTLLNALYGSFGSQSAIDCLINAAGQALVIGKHLVGFEHLFVFATNAEFRLSSHPFNLLAHFGKGGINALAFHLDIFGNRVLYRYARLMKYSVTARHTHDDRQSRQHDGRGILHADMRSEEHTSDIQSLMRISYAVF